MAVLPATSANITTQLIVSRTAIRFPSWLLRLPVWINIQVFDRATLRVPNDAGILLAW